MVLKSSICTLALPWQQRSNLGVRVIQNALFSLLRHTKQLLIVTFCHTTAGNGAHFWTHTRKRTDRRTDGQTDVEVEIVI